MSEASTITMVCSLAGEIDISAACEILPVYHPLNPDGTKFYHPLKTRNKIPYFGIKNAIVCVKYKGAIRGIRQNKGQMNNVISIDLQCCNKNINIKLARQKMQLTGASSEAMGNEAFDAMCEIVNNLSVQLSYFSTLSEKVTQNTMKFLFEHTNNTQLLNTLKPLGKVKIPDNVDEHLLNFLNAYYDDCTSHSGFVDKIYRVMNFKKIADSKISVTHSRISNSVYNYSLGKEISLLSMTNHLYKKGFNVSFHNWCNTHLNVSIPVLNDKSFTPKSKSSTTSTISLSTIHTEHSEEDECNEVVNEEDDNEVVEKEEKIKVHRFIIYRGGSIKQTSPTKYEDAIASKASLMKALEDFKE
jgi:hypothetical protein